MAGRGEEMVGLFEEELTGEERLVPLLLEVGRGLRVVEGGGGEIGITVTESVHARVSPDDACCERRETEGEGTDRRKRRRWMRWRYGRRIGWVWSGGRSRT